MSAPTLDRPSSTLAAVERPADVRGRSAECETLTRLAQMACAGQSQVLVVRGEAGIGKTALLDHLAQTVSGCLVVQTAGTEAERELAFAGLHQFCAPFLDKVSHLPEPRRTALHLAFGLEVGARPDPFLVGLSVLDLLAWAAEDQPLICMVDNAQWLDQISAQTLAFVARRLAVGPVMLIFAGRGPMHPWSGLSELTLRGLSDADARALLDSVVRGPVDERVRHRIVTETRGNPLALLELPLAHTAAELADGLGLPTPHSSSSRVEDGFVHRIRRLSPDTRRLLLLAAAEPLGDMPLLWRAAADLGLGPAAGTAAETAGLTEFAGHLRFVHPLVRSAAYRSASLWERQQAHGALAEATDSASEPDRRAWHRALSTAGPNEEVAAELERSAERALARGGLKAAAAFLERAHRITPGPDRRARRGLTAASLARDAGALDRSLALLHVVEGGPPDLLRSAEVEYLRGQIAWDQRHDDHGARLMRSAAQRLERVHPGRAREMHLQSLVAAMWSRGHRALEQRHLAAAGAASAPPAPEPPRASDLLLDGLAERLTNGYATAVPSLSAALEMIRATDGRPNDASGFRLAVNRVGSIVAVELWDYELARALALRQVEITRTTGASVQLQHALTFLAITEVLAGRLSEADMLTQQERTIAAATGNPALVEGDLLVAACQGDEERVTSLMRVLHAEPAVQGGGRTTEPVLEQYASAVLHNGLGRHDLAEQAAWSLFESGVVGYGSLVVSELAEAASRTGERAHLAAALAWLSDRARVTPTDWVVGLELRTRALLAEGDEVDRLFCAAIRRLGRTDVRAELARTRLLYGEWLRRKGRRVDARTQLRTAEEMLASMGMAAFAERARRELVATGEVVRKRSAETPDDLTAQERRIAQLARDGQTNPEIALRLFISPRTVQYHLRKVFLKLHITSRRQLRDALIAADERSSAGGTLLPPPS